MPCTKYIFITGGVVSSLGKGITAASLGRLLKSRGLRVSLQKMDPYLNFDPGTMSPYQHGEVFVTDDGAETDLDLGHYERFTDINLTKNSNVTTGKIYWSVINKERKGEYSGGTVQVIPHVTNEIKSRIYRVAHESNPDVVITEIGGTVGDIESLPFLEAIRQIKYEVDRENVLFIHVTLVPYLSKAGELKTKPTQHSVKELRSIGIQPDIIVCRTEKPISEDMREKIGLFCNVNRDSVVQNEDADNLYEVPLMLHNEGLDSLIIKKLSLKCKNAELSEWTEIVNKIKGLKNKVTITLVGKYVELHDAYVSVVEALKHAGISNDSDIDIRWVCSEEITGDNAGELLEGADGIIVPGGYGAIDIEGMIQTAAYARMNNIPYFGICIGMHAAVIEYARDVLGLEGAHSTELKEDTPYGVIHLMPGQEDVDDKGGTMRLGLYPCKVAEDTKAYEAYCDDLVFERHRHRYEFNNQFRDKMTAQGMLLSGLSPDESLVEMIELKDHPWYLGCQFHPEFKSRPQRPHPLFREFIRAALEYRGKR